MNGFFNSIDLLCVLLGICFPAIWTGCLSVKSGIGEERTESTHFYRPVRSSTAISRVNCESVLLYMRSLYRVRDSQKLRGAPRGHGRPRIAGYSTNALKHPLLPHYVLPRNDACSVSMDGWRLRDGLGGSGITPHPDRTCLSL
ncbi:hypothetical protein DFH94DRAFT_770252, partial [Russula ochroleuca]